jgi:hypothetical protein
MGWVRRPITRDGRGTRSFASDEALFREVFDMRECYLAYAHVQGYFLTLHVGMNRMLESPSAYAGEVDGSGSAVLLGALVAMEWAGELLWRIARVRWAVIDSMQRHPSEMMPVPS